MLILTTNMERDEAPEVSSKLTIRERSLAKAGKTLGKFAVYAGAGIIGAGVGAQVSPEYQGELADGMVSYTIDTDVDMSALGDTQVSIDTSIGRIKPNQKINSLPLSVSIRPTLERTPSIEKLMESEDEIRQGIKEYGQQLALHAGIGLAAAEAMIYAATRLASRKKLPAREIYMAVAGVTAASSVIAGTGAVTYNREVNFQDYVATGVLGSTLQNWPSVMENYYDQNNVLNAGLRAWAELEQSGQDEASGDFEKDTEHTGLRVMAISDIHLANTYTDIAKIAEQNDIDLVINTGDESEWGLNGEITPEFKASVEQLTSEVPMIWIAGNHDSPHTVAAMRTIPGVIVLGDKQKNSDGSYKVRADEVSAYGLDIIATTDPRVLGLSDEGIYGADDDGSNLKELALTANQQQLKDVPSDSFYNIALSHEPISAVTIPRYIIRDTAGLEESDVVQMTMSGHMHSQNEIDQIQPSSQQPITLREGSTGGGGIRYEGTEGRQSTFSIIDFTQDCQAASVTRIQVLDETNPMQEPTVTTRKLNLSPQEIPAGQVCDVEQGISEVTPVTLGYDSATQGPLQKNGDPY